MTEAESEKKRIGTVKNVSDKYVYVELDITEDYEKTCPSIRINDFLYLTSDRTGEKTIVRVVSVDYTNKIQCRLIGVYKIIEGTRKHVFDFNIENQPFPGLDVFTIEEKQIIDKFYLKGKRLLELMKKY